MSAAGAPSVLVAVPTLGQRLDLLQRALTSLREQVGVVVDVVVVTPECSAALEAIGRRHGARVLVDPGHISAAINRAFAEAGPAHGYVAWLGDDDMVAVGALAQAVAAMEREPSAVMSYADCEYIDLEGRTLFVRRPPMAATWLMHFVPGLVKSEACVFRHKAVQAVGGLDESLRYAMDLDLILKLRRVGSALRRSGIGGRFCWHSGSITIANRRASFKEAQRIQRKRASLWLRCVLWLLQPLLLRAFLFATRHIDARSTATA